MLTTEAIKDLNEEIENKISKVPWTKCFDVAAELIDKKTKPLGRGRGQVMNQLHVFVIFMCFVGS